MNISKNIFCVMLVLISLNLIAGENQVHTINVKGEAKKTLKPNFLKIQINLWGKSKNAKEAQGLLSEEYKRVKKVLDDFKIKEADLKNGMYDLAPQYVWDNEKNHNKLQGYMASQSIQVTYRDMDNVGKIIDELSTPQTETAQGAFGLSLNANHWDHSDRELLERSLMSEAVADAKAKADLLAKASNVKIKGVHKLTPFENPLETPMFASMMEKSGASSPTEIKASEISVQSQVIIEYEIEND